MSFSVNGALRYVPRYRFVYEHIASYVWSRLLLLLSVCLYSSLICSCFLFLSSLSPAFCCWKATDVNTANMSWLLMISFSCDVPLTGSGGHWNDNMNMVLAMAVKLLDPVCKRKDDLFYNKLLGSFRNITPVACTF
jgi:hypothetical protein